VPVTGPARAPERDGPEAGAKRATEAAEPGRPRRAAARAGRRKEQDRALLVAFAEAVRARFPGCPDGEELRVAAYACARHKGRVGRVSLENGYFDEAVELSVVAHVRHRHTGYEALLRRGATREAARAASRAEVSAVLAAWSARPADEQDGGALNPPGAAVAARGSAAPPPRPGSR
jgi:hypothetical protein